MSHQDARTVMGARDWTLLLALSVLWGGSFFFFKVLAAVWPPLTIVLGRVGVAALALNLVLVATGGRMPASPRRWGEFLVMGLLNNVIPFTLIVVGETRISSGLAAVLNATTPLFAIVAAHVWTANEKMTWPRTAGVAFGVLGVAVLVGPDALAGSGRADLLGDGVCLLAAATYAVAGLYGRRFHAMPPLQVATGQVTASTAILLPLAAVVERPWTLPAPSAGTWGALAGIALLCTALAYILFFRILATAGATNLLLVTFLLPVTATLLGVLVLGESMSGWTVAGMALIGLGLAAIDGRPWAAITGSVRARRA